MQTLNRARLEAAAVAQEEANAEYEAHYEQEHPDEYAEADGEYAEEAARCAQCGAATDDLDVDVGDGQLYCAACFAAYDAGDAVTYAGDAAPPPPVAPPPPAAAPSRWAAWAPPAAAAPVEVEEDDDPQFVFQMPSRGRKRARAAEPSAPAPFGAGAAAPTDAAADDEPPGRAYVEPPPRAPPPLPVVEYGDDDGYGTTLRSDARPRRRFGMVSNASSSLTRAARSLYRPAGSRPRCSGACFWRRSPPPWRRRRCNVGGLTE